MRGQRLPRRPVEPPRRQGSGGVIVEWLIRRVENSNDHVAPAVTVSRSWFGGQQRGAHEDLTVREYRRSDLFGPMHRCTPRPLRTLLRAIRIAVIARAADHHRHLAARADILPKASLAHRQAPAIQSWTNPCSACITTTRFLPQSTPHRRPGIRSPRSTPGPSLFLALRKKPNRIRLGKRRCSTHLTSERRGKTQFRVFIQPQRRH
jgi:hypothetical protein